MPNVALSTTVARSPPPIRQTTEPHDTGRTDEMRIGPEDGTSTSLARRWGRPLAGSRRLAQGNLRRRARGPEDSPGRRPHGALLVERHHLACPLPLLPQLADRDLRAREHVEHG